MIARLDRNFFFENCGEVGGFHADLPAAVALAQRDGAVLERVKIHRYAKRRADFVLAAVSLADVAVVVKLDAGNLRPENGINFARLRD